MRKRYESEVTGSSVRNYAKIARALFETEGTKLYPDATFTLRLSYGAVKGYMENGKKVHAVYYAWRSLRAFAKFKQQFPYNLPPRWMEKKSAVDLNTPFNFVSTNDIIGGNSGSPTINQNGELVGLIFDGNIQSLVGDFVYDESVNRAISVDSRGMLEVLKKIFGANEIAAELELTQAKDQNSIAVRDYARNKCRMSHLCYLSLRLCFFQASVLLDQFLLPVTRETHR